MRTVKWAAYLFGGIAVAGLAAVMTLGTAIFGEPTFAALGFGRGAVVLLTMGFTAVSIMVWGLSFWLVQRAENYV